MSDFEKDRLRLKDESCGRLPSLRPKFFTKFRDRLDTDRRCRVISEDLVIPTFIVHKILKENLHMNKSKKYAKIRN